MSICARVFFCENTCIQIYIQVQIVAFILIWFDLFRYFSIFRLAAVMGRFFYRLLANAFSVFCSVFLDMWMMVMELRNEFVCCDWNEKRNDLFVSRSAHTGNMGNDWIGIVRLVGWVGLVFVQLFVLFCMFFFLLGYFAIASALIMPEWRANWK